MKSKLKKYRVVCRLESFGYAYVTAKNKKEATQMAYDVDHMGEVDFGDSEMTVIEVREEK